MSIIKVAGGWFGPSTLAEALAKSRDGDELLVGERHVPADGPLKISVGVTVRPLVDGERVTITQPLHIVGGSVRLQRLRLEAGLTVSGDARLVVDDCEDQRRLAGPRRRIADRLEAAADRPRARRHRQGLVRARRLHGRGGADARHLARRRRGGHGAVEHRQGGGRLRLLGREPDEPDARSGDGHRRQEIGRARGRRCEGRLRLAAGHRRGRQRRRGSGPRAHRAEGRRAGTHHRMRHPG